MRALVRAELIKLRSTRLPVVLLAATLGLVVLTIATSVPGVFEDTGLQSIDDPRFFAVLVGVGFGVPQVMMALLGVLAVTQEFRYGTVSSTYLSEPRRSRVLVAKWLTMVIASVPTTLLTLAVSVPLGVTLIRSQGSEVAVTAQLWQTVAAAFVVMATYGVIGVALGALVRNQIAGVVSVLVWMLAVEQIVIPVLPVVGRWMPWGAVSSLLQVEPSYGFDGDLLSPLLGGIVLLGYTVVAVVLAQRLSPGRDVH